jgi:sugar lactone lactonase YvrE
MVQTTEATVVVDVDCELGEAPTWDAVGDRLLWLDIDRCRLFELTTAGLAMTALAERTTAVVPAVDGGLVAVVGISVARLDAAGHVTRVIAELPPDGDGVANDARCDPHGRLWVGTLDRSGARRAGLFVVSSDGEVRTVKTDCALSNGLDWSPDGMTCYFADSLARRVERLHLGSDGLPVGSSVLFETELMPDGLSVDADGGVWVAFWDGGVVRRYTPAGDLDHVVEVPRGGFVTSCAFGGDGLRTLYVTTAASGLSDAEVVGSTHAGALFAGDVGVSGRGYTPFG